MNSFYEVMEYIQQLMEAKKRGEISDFKIIWDHDEEKLYADLSFKPTKVIEFINLNFIAVNTNVSFSEIVNQKDTIQTCQLLTQRKTMSKEVEKKTCPECESTYKLLYDLDLTSGYPKFCPFCSCEIYDVNKYTDEEE